MIRAIALTGPTASGKTAASLAIAEALGCEIISLDSMQVYRGMDIGTAKATEQERERVPHHMIDLVMPSEPFSQEEYKALAILSAEDITRRGKIPLFVGGTGLYYDALTRGDLESPPQDEELSSRLTEQASTPEGRDILWNRLYEVDRESAEKIHKNNTRRLVRALEIYELTGMRKSDFDAASRVAVPPIQMALITLDFHNRQTLYERVNRRVDEMIAAGLLDEVTRLYEAGMLKGENTASQAIGYKELVGYIRGEATLEESVEEIKLATRRYAKRQATWWRHHPERTVIYVDDEDGIVRDKSEFIDEVKLVASSLYKGLMV